MLMWPSITTHCYQVLYGTRTVYQGTGTFCVPGTRPGRSGVPVRYEYIHEYAHEYKYFCVSYPMQVHESIVFMGVFMNIFTGVFMNIFMNTPLNPVFMNTV